MTGRRGALLSAMAVEAAAGLAAASVANATGNGHEAMGVFVLCTLAVAATDMVLIPGWVWAAYPPVWLRLLKRAAMAVLTLAAAIAAAYAVFGAALILLGQLWTGAPGAIVFGLPFLVAGTVAGAGAATAEMSDAQPGIVQAPWWVHLAGGVLGVALVLLLAAVVGMADSGVPARAEPWWPLLGLVPATMALGGGIRHVLMAREAAQTGTDLAGPGPLVGRTLVACVPFLVLAAAAPALATA